MNKNEATSNDFRHLDHWLTLSSTTRQTYFNRHKEAILRAHRSPRPEQALATEPEPQKPRKKKSIMDIYEKAKTDPRAASALAKAKVLCSKVFFRRGGSSASKPVGSSKAGKSSSRPSPIQFAKTHFGPGGLFRA